MDVVKRQWLAHDDGRRERQCERDDRVRNRREFRRCARRARTNWRTELYGDAGRGTCPAADTRPNACARAFTHADSVSDANTNSVTNARTESDANAYTESIAGAYTESIADACADSVTDAYAKSGSVTESYPDADTYTGASARP